MPLNTADDLGIETYAAPSAEDVLSLALSNDDGEQQDDGDGAAVPLTDDDDDELTLGQLKEFLDDGTFSQVARRLNFRDLFCCAVWFGILNA